MIKPAEVTGPPRLEVNNLTRHFGPTIALDHINLTITSGSIHGLVGLNGSGKSTLVKILAGIYEPHDGVRAYLNGQPVELNKLASTHRNTVRFVHQDLGLIPEMTTLENLNFYRGTAGKQSQILEMVSSGSGGTRPQSSSFTPRFDVHIPVRDLKPIQRVTVAIAAALKDFLPSRGLLVLDEPTSPLDRAESQKLLELVSELRERGTSVIFVSHRLEEVLAITDMVTILRNGSLVVTAPTSSLNTNEVIDLMVGGGDGQSCRHKIARRGSPKPTTLQIRNLSGGSVRTFNLDLHRGEIVGLAGLPGSGADEVPRLLTDQRKTVQSGSVRIGGRDWVSVKRFQHRNVVLVPADRRDDGLIPQMSVSENLTIGSLEKVASSWRIRRRQELEYVAQWIRHFDIAVGGASDKVETLSGGNQQKVLLARCLAMGPEVLLLCNPTVGVDVRARFAIYDMIESYAKRGLSILISSSDGGDLVSLCDRVLVLRDGRVAAELPASNLTEASLESAVHGVDRCDV